MKSDHTAVSQRHRSLQSFPAYEQNAFPASSSPLLYEYLNIWIAFFCLYFKAILTYYPASYHLWADRVMPRLTLLFHSVFFSFRMQIQAPLSALSKEQLMQLQNSGS